MSKYLELFENILFIINLAKILLYEYAFYIFFNRNYKYFISRVALDFSKINVLYVKLFQAFALDNTFIDEEINEVLLKYVDNVPYSEDDIDIDSLVSIMRENELTYDSDISHINVVNNIENNLINSGMISIVFKLIDANGKIFILKMKRNNIERKLTDALEKVNFLLNIISYLNLFSKLNISSVIRKNFDVIIQQTDFKKEVKNIELMKKTCKHLKYVEIPNVYKEITNKYPNTILMDYIDGKTINNIDVLDYEHYAKLIVKFGYASVLNFGIVHGDLHCGNILFIKSKSKSKTETETQPCYKLGIIDLGILIEIDKVFRNNLIDLFSELESRDSCDTAKKLLKYLFINSYIFDQIPLVDYDNIINSIASIIDSIIKENKVKANQVQMYKIISILDNYLKNNVVFKNIGLIINDEFSKLQLALAMSHGITLRLAQNNFEKITKDALRELFGLQYLLDDE